MIRILASIVSIIIGAMLLVLPFLDGTPSNDPRTIVRLGIILPLGASILCFGINCTVAIHYKALKIALFSISVLALLLSSIFSLIAV
jgi:hypothetical protein